MIGTQLYGSVTNNKQLIYGQWITVQPAHAYCKVYNPLSKKNIHI